jgi:hypothetical protein
MVTAAGLLMLTFFIFIVVEIHDCEEGVVLSNTILGKKLISKN